MTPVSVTSASGTVDAVSLVAGEPIDRTLGAVWSAHVEAHLERCGSVGGPLAEWVCRLGHPLWGTGPR